MAGPGVFGRLQHGLFGNCWKESKRQKRLKNLHQLSNGEILWGGCLLESEWNQGEV